MLLWVYSLSGQSINLFNSSFEGEARDAINPIGWIGCEDGTTPDILPGPWGVYLPAAEGQTYKDFLNPDSLKVITALIEPAVLTARILDKYQFERTGYFSVDNDSTPENLVFNRVVPLRDSWSKVEKVK